MSLTKITTPELLDFPNDSTSSANTSGTVIPAGNTAAQPSTNLNAGEFRLNTTTGYVEYYDSSNWQQIADEYISGQPTACICNYPITASALYELNDNANDTCGNYDSNGQTSITYSAGLFGKAADFNGSTSSINFAANPIAWGSTNYSISFWFNASASLSTYTAFISTYGSNGWSIDTGSTTNTLRYYFDGGTSANLYSGTFSLNTWNHVVITMDHSSEAIIYLNKTANNTTGSGLGTNDGNTIMIGDNTSMGNPITGQMDQIRIFSTVLTPTQITELYNEVVCN